MNTMIRMEQETPFRAVRIAPIADLLDFASAGPRTLVQSIQAAMGAVHDSVLKPLFPNENSPFALTRAVVALLAECYATQIYASTAVAHLAANNPDFQWPWWENFPDAGVLRRCRAENREAMHRCLVTALRFLQEKKFYRVS